AGLQEADAEDLVQDVLATLVRALPDFRYDRHKSFRRWLATVALNAWRDRRKRRATRPLPGEPEGLEDIPDRADPDAFWEADYRRHLVRRTLEALQDEFQPTTWRACWEVLIQGHAPAEVAAELGLTAGSVYAAKFRAIKRLRRELGGMLD